MGAKEDAVVTVLINPVKPEGIEHLTRRVIRRDVHCIKVVTFKLDLRPLKGLEAHCAKRRSDLPDGLRYGVQTPPCRTTAGQRHVDSTYGSSESAYRSLSLVVRGLQLVLQTVRRLSKPGPLLRRERSNASEQKRDLSTSTDVPVTPVL